MSTATLHVSINVSCPKCDEYLDLFDEEESGVLNDEGQLWDIINRTRIQGGWKNLGIECVCYKCKTEFKVEEMEY